MSAADPRLRWFSYGRQRLGCSGRDPDAVLRDVVAVYSAHPTAPLSLLARCEPFDADAYRALDAVRLPAMRGSIHLLPHETAHLAFRAIARAGGVEGDSGLTPQEYGELRSAVAAAATEPMTARELREATGAQGPLAPVLNALTREGALIRLGAHGLRSNELFYVAGAVAEADADEALAWLAEQYLRAFGPARPQDFQWWAGVSRARAQTALETVDTEVLDDGLLLMRADSAAFERAAPVTGTLDLLPKWDCYTMGYPRAGGGASRIPTSPKSSMTRAAMPVPWSSSMEAPPGPGVCAPAAGSSSSSTSTAIRVRRRGRRSRRVPPTSAGC